tara:strand:+ start:57417 stop:57833 length:417 start_codon:yes stop_codon:yes gene_type:complete
MKVMYVLTVVCIVQLLGSCEDLGDDIRERIKENTGETCGFSNKTIPQYMRELREEYNNQKLMPDSEGNQQSYEKCKADLQATELYREKLDNVNHILDDYCVDRNNQRNQEHRKNVEKLRADLKRQIDETDCESLYGEG